MFTAGKRDSIREQLLGSAERDPAVVGAAITGSHAVDGGDRWSDIDLAFGIDGSLDAVMHRWTEMLYGTSPPFITGTCRPALACLRLGHPTSYAKGAHLLPPEVTSPLETTLVRALNEAELTRALSAATDALIGESALADAALAARLAFVLSDLRTDIPRPDEPDGSEEPSVDLPAGSAS
ncbi:hypothetical protein AB0J27_21935 [Micromonospora chokoriensis]